ncbi:MAG: class I SAM-dependent methyltransferase [Gammaproteobacteria bacterium]|nr:class I SAM-dependent methyltransferase [Gammaproteobacteria bacterium]
MIREAKRSAAKEHNKAKFQFGVIEALPFDDERFDIVRFDVVLSSMMLHHLPPEVKVAGLRETFRVLKPGGRLMVIDVDKPTGLLGRILMYPWHKNAAVKDNIEGHITGFIHATWAPCLARMQRNQDLSCSIRLRILMKSGVYYLPVFIDFLNMV